MRPPSAARRREVALRPSRSRHVLVGSYTLVLSSTLNAQWGNGVEASGGGRSQAQEQDSSWYFRDDSEISL